MVGQTYGRRLAKLNIRTVEDLLYHLPVRYDDLSFICPISQLRIGDQATVQGKIISFQNQTSRFGKKIQKIILQDSSGQIQSTWFNQPFLAQTLKPGLRLNLAGKVSFFGQQKNFASPAWEIVKPQPSLHTGRLVPVYAETKQLSSKWLRSRIAPLLEKNLVEIPEFLPGQTLKDNSLWERKTAFFKIHFPQNQTEAEKAKKRFAFEELLLLELAVLQRKTSYRQKKAVAALSLPQDQLDTFFKTLPFQLTGAQKRATAEILADLEKPQPMNRLLEGDVGSGKTVVAAAAILAASQSGYQTALMAPTEILAQQHAQNLKKMLHPLKIKVSLLTGKIKKTPRDFDLLVGTQALLHQKAQFRHLGLVIVDEQHRFGVTQRNQLLEKNTSGSLPHLLTMTATPIPRTVALTLYGDLEVSFLDELPPGRLPVKTWVIPETKRTAAYTWLKKIIAGGGQVFIVCPLIEESASQTLAEVKSVKTEYDRLLKVFPDIQLDLLHSQLKSPEKEKILCRFRQGKTKILVATPVIEVGLDIPQASVILIEGAERFGLAQLHQLRGRVGRNQQQAYCLLFSAHPSPLASKRLKSLENNFNGTELAQIDLQIRGPGEIYGREQHGFFRFRAADLSDLAMIRLARTTAQKLLAQLKEYPLLQEKLKEDKISQIQPN